MPTAEQLWDDAMGHVGQGNLDAAASLLRGLVEVQPTSVRGWETLGGILVCLGKHAEAEPCLRRALAIDPQRADANNNLAVILRHQGRLADAIAHLHHTLAVQPENVQALLNLGNVYQDARRLDQAMAAYRRAIELDPHRPGPYVNLGNLFYRLGRADDAISHFEKALELRPNFAQDADNHSAVHVCLANVLVDTGDKPAAEHHFRQALDLAEARTGLGNLLCASERQEEGFVHLHEALRLNPHLAEAHLNLHIALRNQERWDESLASYREAMRRRPDWVLEWDRMIPAWGECLRRHPVWDGSPLAGKTLLLVNNGGIGDAVQLVRLAAFAKQPGTRVILSCPRRWHRLLLTCPVLDDCHDPSHPLPHFDFWDLLPRLVERFGLTTGNIPAPIPYLQADEELVRRWEPTIRQVGGFKVGIAWQGNPRFERDRWRSLPLEKFAPLAQVREVRLIALQKGLGVEQPHSFDVVDLRPRDEEDTFTDTAAILKHLDLVITSDTSLAHVAGALGVPVWVALCALPDRRWLLDRDDSPWYPTMRLFRQATMGEWDDVFRRIADALQNLVQPPPIEARWQKARHLARRGDWPAAQSILAGILTERPEFPEVWELLGVVLLQLGQADAGERCFRHALSLRPQFPEAHNNLAFLLRSQGKLDEAERHLRQALEVRPTFVQAHINLGNVHSDAGRLDEAVASYRTALSLNSNIVEPHSNLGAVLRRQGKVDEAEAAFHEALRLQPDNAVAHYNLGALLADLGRRDLARIHLEAAIRARPNFAEAQNRLHELAELT